MNRSFEKTPPSVRILEGMAELIRTRRGLVFAGLLVVFALAWLSTGIFTVENGQTAVVTRFGKVRAEGLGPGLQFRLPDPIESETIFAGAEVFRLEIGETNGAKLQMISGDENLIATSLVVQYKVTDVPRFLFGCSEPEEVVGQVVRTALAETIAEMEVDEILTTGKAQIQNRVRQTSQEHLRDYDLGVSLLATTLQSVEPPTEAAISFRAVQDSRTEAARTISDGQMLREHVLSLTRAESNQMIEEAGSAAEARVQEAKGAAERFRALLARHRQAPEQTRLDLFQQELEAVAKRAETIVLSPGQKPEIDVNMRSSQSK